jgi:hypothetical protein
MRGKCTDSSESLGLPGDAQMNYAAEQITLEQWDSLYDKLVAAGLDEPCYGGPLSRHVRDGDLRLAKLRFDNSPAALNLWNFLLTEEQRLHQAKAAGKKIIGAMKDLGTVPVMAYSFQNVVAFYPDGAWWTPCIMEFSDELLNIADSLGIDESFCPVRAMLGAFVNKAHFPEPDLLTCSVGAVCDDFSAIAQKLQSMGHEIEWWEVPHRRHPQHGEQSVPLPGGFEAPQQQVDLVKSELCRIKKRLEDLAEQKLNDKTLSAGIAKANQIRARLHQLRNLTFTATKCPLGAAEMLVAEMLAIHFCSDQIETLKILDGLIRQVNTRTNSGQGFLSPDAAKIFWVNPPADIRVMNLLEDCGGRIAGTDYMFAHAIDLIPEDIPPMQALAMAALADPMVGPAADRAEHICCDSIKFGSEAVVISRIPGASHCALEGRIIADVINSKLKLPVAEIEVPTVIDSIIPTLKTRLEALVETVKQRRKI